jgi:F-type H+-transporting ATPase subunit alpha
VSRVGGAAQTKAMKGVSGTLKLDLAQFRELEAFATFGSELDAISRAQLDRGERLVELLKQPLNSPMPVEEQVVSIFVGTTGLLDDLPVNEVRRFETELLEWMRGRYGGLLAEIRDAGSLPAGDALAQAVSDFKTQFVATLADDAAAADADPLATDAEAPGDPESDKTLETE